MTLDIAGGQSVAPPILSVDSLSVALPVHSQRLLGVDGVSFDVEAGHIRCLVGESGSGKSLTAQSILGLLPRRFASPTGRIAFEGADILRMAPAELRRIRGNRIGMIFQEPMSALNPLWRVGDQIDEVLYTHTDLDKAARRERIAHIMGEVNLPDEALLSRYPHELSGGQRQRVMIAMALVLEPRLLIADEPTTALDVTTQAQILKLIRDLQHRHGTAVLFITHDFGVVTEIADTVTVMKDGRVVESGSASDTLGNPQNEYTRRLLDAVPKGDFGVVRPCPDGEAVLSVRNLSKIYRPQGLLGRRQKPFQALSDISFDIHPTEIVGLVGESGSGKSTIARCVSRLTSIDAGSVTIKGTELSTLGGGALRRSRQAVQMVFQDPYSSLNPRRRIGDLIVQGPLNFGRPKEQALARAGELLEMVGLDRGALWRFPSDFSGGQRQRIGLARALVLEPALLIADEAVSALDVSVQAQVLRLIKELRQSLGFAVLFITHDLRVAAELCDRIIVLHRGLIVEAGLTRDVLTNPTHDYTRLLIEAVPGKLWERTETAAGAAS